LIGTGPDLLVAERLEQSVDVRAVRLVPDHVGSDVLGREKNDHVAHLLDTASPVVRRTARFHHHRRRGKLGHERQEAIPPWTLPPDHATGPIRNPDLEDFLCDIYSDKSIVLHGMGSFLSFTRQRLWHIDAR